MQLRSEIDKNGGYFWITNWRNIDALLHVRPEERPAAASFTTVPRSLASALSPTLGGALFATGFLAARLVDCGILKISYGLMLWSALIQGKAETNRSIICFMNLLTV